MTISEKKQLMETACKVRMGVIEGTYGAKAGHPGGSLSAADVFTYLYNELIRCSCVCVSCISCFFTATCY